MEFCLKAWLTGILSEGPFFKKAAVSSYKVYQADLVAWCRLEKVITTNWRKTLFKWAE